MSRLSSPASTRRLRPGVGLDVSGDAPEEVDRYPTVRQPDTVAVSPGAEAVWVSGRSDGVVQRVER